MSSNYNKQLKGFAKYLRKDSTPTEIILWLKVLRNDQTGFSFLRQRPIGKYIADFLCRKLKLVIEVDGYSHNFKHEEDIIRDEELLKLGYLTLRFHDEEILNDLENVERTITHEIEIRAREIDNE
jgi:very-short-patch-repair endonuclease